MIARLYVANGDAIARLGEADDESTVAVSLAGSRAQRLAVDPNDPDTVFTG